MAKVTGLGAACAVDKSDGSVATISNDVTSLSWETPREEQVVTGIDVSAQERNQLLADMTTKIEGIFNPALSHLVFRTVPSTTVARTTTITVSSQVLAAELLYNNYSLERGDDGALTWSTEGALQSGLVPTWA
jgi:hypothetical protein